MVSLNIHKKNSTNKFGRKTGFKIENEIEDRDKSIPKFIGILTQVFCTFGPNLVILAWTGDELSCRQAQNGVTFDFEVKFDLEGRGQGWGQFNSGIGIAAQFQFQFRNWNWNWWNWKWNWNWNPWNWNWNWNWKPELNFRQLLPHPGAALTS